MIINSIIDFYKWYKTLDGNSYIFRGQADESWPLVSSAYRRLLLCNNLEIDFNAIAVYTRDLLVRAKMRGILDAQQSDFDLLAQLQHHGAATPLLDFTENFFVALWFACSTESQKNGKIFIVNRENPCIKELTLERIENQKRLAITITDYFSGYDVFDKLQVESPYLDYTAKELQELFLSNNLTYRRMGWIWEPLVINPRIKAQKSIFLLTHDASALAATSEVVISQKIKEEMCELVCRLLNLNEEGIYPDISGFSQANSTIKSCGNMTFPFYYHRQGVKCLQRGLYQDAKQRFTAFLNLRPNNAIGFQNRAMANVELQCWMEAISDFSSAIKLEPNKFENYINRGNAYAAIHKNIEALNDYTKVTTLAPEEPAAYFNRGIVYGRQKDYCAAINDLGTAIKYGYNNHMTFYNLALAYNYDKQYEKAIEFFSKAISLSPQSTYALYRGSSFAALHKMQEAIKDFTTAIELDPKNINALLYRANAYILTQKYDAAINDASHIISLDPNNYDAYGQRSIAYEKIGKSELAMADLESFRAIQIRNNNQ